MEFQFTRNTLMGEYYVKCSMGHEIVGRWLQDEINKNRDKIDEVIGLIAQSKRSPSKEHVLLGREISLLILGDEVTVKENVLNHDVDVEFDTDFDFYNCESTASCGIEDFEALIDQWMEFLGYSPASY